MSASTVKVILAAGPSFSALTFSLTDFERPSARTIGSSMSDVRQNTGVSKSPTLEDSELQELKHTNERHDISIDIIFFIK